MVRLDHVAIATHSPEKLQKILALLGLQNHGSEKVESQSVNTVFVKPDPSSPNIEILVPLEGPAVAEPKGAVAKFLAKKGPGFHHLSFQVDDILAMSAKLRSEGIQLIYDFPQLGAHKAQVNFIHPESSGGVLIELSQKPA